jgi:hypothetical protein
MPALNEYEANVYSQFGEDGVIERIFRLIGEGTRVCCEFGAWDGVHLSNTRALIDRGWRGIFIEADRDRFADLKRRYPDSSRHLAINAAVDDREMTIGRLLAQHRVDADVDFLSIDIDGEDYYILRSLDVRPRLICIEVVAANDPASLAETPREIARNGVGQPLALFTQAAEEHGYRLICFTSNAFYLRTDVGRERDLPTLTPVEAWNRYLERRPPEDRFWLYRMNLGLESPYYRFDNSRLSARDMRLPTHVVLQARLRRRRAK